MKFKATFKNNISGNYFTAEIFAPNWEVALRKAQLIARYESEDYENGVTLTKLKTM